MLLLLRVWSLLNISRKMSNNSSMRSENSHVIIMLSHQYKMFLGDFLYLFPKKLRNAKVEEFVKLMQGRMSAKEYTLNI